MSYSFFMSKYPLKLEGNEIKKLKFISKQIDNLSKIKNENINMLKRLPDDLLETYGIKKHIDLINLKYSLERNIKNFYNIEGNIIYDEGLSFEYSIDIFKDELYVIIKYNNKSYMSKEIKTFEDFLEFIREIKNEVNKRFHNISLFKKN